MTLTPESIFEIFRFILVLMMLGFMFYVGHKMLHKDDRWDEQFK